MRRARKIAAGFVVAVALLFVAWHAVVAVGSFPMELLHPSDASSLVVRDANHILLRQEATSSGARESWVALADISPHLAHATIASEDHHFYRHAGIDWAAVARAGWLNIRRMRPAFGASTLTMQLVRITAGARRSVPGKLRQMVLAARLEKRLTKREILEHYLNRVYYGNSAWGASQAARHYFGKLPSELSAGEAALLAVFPRGPSHYDPYRNWSKAIARRDYILTLMHKRGFLTKSELDLAIRTPISVRDRRVPFRAPHFVDYIKSTLPASFSAGTEVVTTLDLDLQQRVEVLVRSHLRKLRWRNMTQAGVVVMSNRDGSILAMVGSHDYFDRNASGEFNAVTARLRPGSTLKPFVYAAAMERGDTPASMAFDVPLNGDRGQFYTKDVRSHGFARYREALAGSYNLSAVHTLQRVGIPPMLRLLRAAGLGTLDHPDGEYDWGLAIGHAEVRLIDLVSAFSLFGRGGAPVAPRAIVSAVSADGARWSQPMHERERVFSEEVTYLVYDILSDPDARKPMFGDRVPLNLPFPVALKTGTTKAYTDNWAIGVTSEYTVGVWSGNFDGSPTHQVMSVQGATPLVRAVYSAISSRFGAPTAPPRPAAIDGDEICPLSGKRPGPHCPHRKSELFVSGHGPDDVCDWHVLVCESPGIVYPAEVRAWTEKHGRSEPISCLSAPSAQTLRIIAPSDGATFHLEPHRSAALQKPPMAAIPDTREVRWLIDGTPVESWTPTPGRHLIVAEDGNARDQVEIVYQ